MESEPSALSGLRISCIVPVHNGEAYLADAIASILAQSHRLIEVIVVDDGSGDRSNAIAHSFGDPVRVVRLDEQRGPGYARASGVAAATGDVIGFLDADDLWLPQKLERQIVHMAGPPRLDVSFCQIENFWVEGFESEAAHWTAMGRTLGTYLLQTALARREVLDRVPLDPDRKHFEHVAWVRSLQAAKVPIGVLAQPMVRRRRHKNNETRTNFAEHYEALFDLVKESIDSRRRACP